MSGHRNLLLTSASFNTIGSLALLSCIAPPSVKDSDDIQLRMAVQREGILVAVLAGLEFTAAFSDNQEMKRAISTAVALGDVAVISSLLIALKKGQITAKDKKFAKASCIWAGIELASLLYFAWRK